MQFHRRMLTIRVIWLCLFLSITTPQLSACGSSPDYPITPAVDHLTFLFFYTDG